MEMTDPADDFTPAEELALEYLRNAVNQRRCDQLGELLADVLTVKRKDESDILSPR
jgi:hypothetical protein